MADTKTTALTANTAPLATDLLYMVDDPGGSALSQKLTFATARESLALGVTPTGRLTLTTATPVTTADVSAATTLYYTPYNGNMISLYDGTSWRTVSYVEVSIALAALTASKPYDIFGVLTAGTLALEALVWTNGTTRATALAYQDGRLVKSGAATRLYLGSIYVNASGGQTDDSLLKRFVWNYYNRVSRPFFIIEATNSWTYTTATYRPWNNSTANRAQFIIGVSEDIVKLVFTALGAHSVAGYTRVSGIGLDVTDADSSGLPGFGSAADVSEYQAAIATFNKVVAAGYHYLQLLEYAEAGGGTVATWWGDVGVTYIQSGATGEVKG